jgi:hypothetical protein
MPVLQYDSSMKTSRLEFIAVRRAQNSRRNARHWSLSRSDATNDFFSREAQAVQSPLDGRAAGRDLGSLLQSLRELLDRRVRHRRHNLRQQVGNSPMDWRLTATTFRQRINLLGLAIPRQDTIDRRVSDVE